MPPSDEAQAFTHAVCSAVQEIPHGRVTTYGHIALLVGTPQRPRQVGICMKHLAAPESHARFTTDTVPWQRVVSAKGIIAPRSHPGGASRQADALRNEGVIVNRGALGELSVDLETYGWFPRALPSEASDNSDSQSRSHES